MFQVVVDTHQFLGTGGHRVRQQAGLVAPDNGLHPGVHCPSVVAVPHIIYTEGMGLIGKDAGGVGIEIGHHGGYGRVRNGLGAAPGMALQRPAHTLALFSTEAHCTLSVQAEVHLVEVTGSQAGRHIGNAVVGTVIHLDRVRAGCEGCGGEQSQQTDQHQQSRDQAVMREVEFFHSLSFSFLT